MSVQLSRLFYDPTYIQEPGGDKTCIACLEPFNDAGKRPIVHTRANQAARHAFGCETCWPGLQDGQRRRWIDSDRVTHLQCTLCNIKCQNEVPLENPPAAGDETVNVTLEDEGELSVQDIAAIRDLLRTIMPPRGGMNNGLEQQQVPIFEFFTQGRQFVVRNFREGATLPPVPQGIPTGVSQSLVNTGARAASSPPSTQNSRREGAEIRATAPRQPVATAQRQAAPNLPAPLENTAARVNDYWRNPETRAASSPPTTQNSRREGAEIRATAPRQPVAIAQQRAAANLSAPLENTAARVNDYWRNPETRAASSPPTTQNSRREGAEIRATANRQPAATSESIVTKTIRVAVAAIVQGAFTLAMIKLTTIRYPGIRGIFRGSIATTATPFVSSILVHLVISNKKTIMSFARINPDTEKGRAFQKTLDNIEIIHEKWMISSIYFWIIICHFGTWQMQLFRIGPLDPISGAVLVSMSSSVISQLLKGPYRLNNF